MKSVNYLKSTCQIILGGVLFFLSCSENNKTRINKDKVSIGIDVTKATSFDINSVADLVKYVPLETNNESLIGSINKLYIVNDSILVFDRKTKNIFLFNQNGKFVRKIGKKGNGPSEYIEFNDIYYDFDTNKLYAFERFQNKMFVYFLDGNLNEIINSHFSFNSFIKTHKGFWIYSCFNNNNPCKFNLIYTNDKLNTIKNGFFPQKNFVNITNEPCFSEDKEHNKYFYYPSSNIIYQLNDNIIEPFLEINFFGKTLPYSEIINTKTIDEYDKIINRENYVGFIENVHILEQFCIFNCLESNLNETIKSFQVWINLDRREVNVYDGYKNVVGSPSLNYLLYTTDKKELVYSINPSALMDKEIEELKKIIPSISYDSNPIIVFYKIKLST
jgi:hypothetical protein